MSGFLVRCNAIFTCAQPCGATLNRRELRHQVALPLLRSPHVRQHQIQQIAVEGARPLNLYRGNAQTLLINLAGHGHGARTHAADIGMMRAIGQEEGGLARGVDVHGRHGGDVG